MNERVTRMLKNYRSYEFAVKSYNSWDGKEDWGCRRIATARGDLIVGLNEYDYRQYLNAVTQIKAAVDEVLSDDMQMVIKYKYLERNTLTLAQIAVKLHCHEQRAKYLHKKALKELSQALVFVTEPEIHNLDFHLQVANA